MGTGWSVQCYAALADQAAILHGLENRLNQVIAQMSHWDQTSSLSRFNRARPGTIQTLEPEFFTVMDYATFLARQTRGAYDPTAGKLVNLWGFGPEGKTAQIAEQIPAAEDIAACLHQPNWRQLDLQRLTRQITQTGGICLDLSSIAKGYAVDLLASWLESQDICSYLVEVGGELRGKGIKPDFQPWWVSIETPYASLPEMEYVIALHDVAIATSGNYRQFFERDGKRYSHTLDPRSGYPVDNDLASVTVVDQQCMVADALATAFTVMGLDEAMQYADAHQIAALFHQQQPDGFSIRLSRSMQAMCDHE